MWVSFVLAHVVEQVIKDVSDHLNLLLALKIVIGRTCPLISHKLLTSVSLHSLQVTENVLNSRAQLVKMLAHLLGLLGIIILLTVWVIVITIRRLSIWIMIWELCVCSCGLSPVIRLVALTTVYRLRAIRIKTIRITW